MPMTRHRRVIAATGLTLPALYAMLAFAGVHPRAAPAVGAGAQPPPPQGPPRWQIHRRIVSDIDHGNLAAARAAVENMLASPATPIEAVQAHRLLAAIARRENNPSAAERSLDDATAALDARPDLAAAIPSLRLMILMDRAEIAMTLRRDRAAAIELFDQVLAQRDVATPRDAWIAAQNAAMLSADLRRFRSAVERVDALMDSPAAAQVSINQAVKLRACQVSWLEQAGDLAGAWERAHTFWRQYGERDDAVVFDVGLFIARGYPVPQHCEQRLALASQLLDRLRALRANGSANPDAPSGDLLDTLQRQVLVVIADSIGCDSPMVPPARQSLGVPPQP